MSPEIVTPDGITEGWKRFIESKLGWRYSPWDIKSIIDLVDWESRKSMLDRSWWTKVADAFKRALPLVDSTSEKMWNALAKLFEKQIPADIEELKVAILNVTKW